MIRKSMIACMVAVFAIGVTFAAQAEEHEHYKLGSEVKPFALSCTGGNEQCLEAALGEKVIVLYFWNFKCPFIVEYEEHLSEVYSAYQGNENVVFWVIDSNHDNTNEEIEKYVEDNERPYFVIRDPENKIADLFAAERTPEVFVIGKDKKIHYHGAVADNTRVDDAETFYMKDAISAILAGEEPEVKETRSFGCTIKRVPSA